GHLREISRRTRRLQRPVAFLPVPGQGPVPGPDRLAAAGRLGGTGPMQDILLFALLGLGQGALIAGISVGVVVTYRGSGVINLATGAVAMVSGYLFWALTGGFFGFSWPTALALPAALAIALLVGLAVEFAVFAPLRTAAPLARLAGSLGALLTLQAGVLL